jgi:hypothetical protein
MLVMWFAAVLVIILSARVYSKLQSLDYDEVAVPYLMSIIPQISQWNPEATRALMVAEVSEAIPDEQFNRGIAMFSRLGELQSMSDPEFENVYRDQETIIGKQTIVEYNTEAKYANGDATINVKLLDKDGHFEIYRINFSSKVLLQ